MQICQKPNCTNQSILRGKYCEIHKTTQRRRYPPIVERKTEPLSVPYSSRSSYSPPISSSYPPPSSSRLHPQSSSSIDRETQLLIDRLLKEEQEAEYLDAMERDAQIQLEKQLREIEEKTKEESFIDRQRSR